jgi:hypothetical protein
MAEFDSLVLTKAEVRALYTWIKREFIPHNEDYDMLVELSKKLYAFAEEPD